MDVERFEKHLDELERELAAAASVEEIESLTVRTNAYRSLVERLRGRRIAAAGRDDHGRRRASASAMGLRTGLTGCRTVTMTVSQLFRMTDLLLDPAAVAAEELQEIIHSVAKLRRVLSVRREVPVPGLGSFVSVASLNDRLRGFWSLAIPDLRSYAPEARAPLILVPFQLSPLRSVADMRINLDGWLHEVLSKTVGAPGQNMRISSLQALLRVYSTGVGVVRLTLFLEASAEVEVEVIAALARRIETLLFVDPDGQDREFESVMGDIVADVAQRLLVDAGEHDRRWQPPDTIIRFHQGTFTPETHTRELAYLMSLAPGNHDEITNLRQLVEARLRLPYWKNDGVLALAAQRVVLLLRKPGELDHRFRRRLLEDAVETHELVSAGLHTRRVFAEDLARHREQGGLHNLRPGTANFVRLSTLLDTIERVARAVAGVEFHLKRTRQGILDRFARELVATNAAAKNAPVNGGAPHTAAKNTHRKDELAYELDMVARAVEDTGYATQPEFAALLVRTNAVAAIEPPFPNVHPDPPPSIDAKQEALESEVVAALSRLDALLVDESAFLPEIDAAIVALEVARRSLLR